MEDGKKVGRAPVAVVAGGRGRGRVPMVEVAQVGPEGAGELPAGIMVTRKGTVRATGTPLDVSTFSEEDEKDFKRCWDFPANVLLRRSGPTDRMSQPLEGEICVNKYMFNHGLRFPVCPEIKRFLNDTGLCLAQLNINMLGLMTEYVIHCKWVGVPARTRWFLSFFCFKMSTTDAMFTCSPRPGKSQYLKLMLAFHGKTMDWRPKFCFLSLDAGVEGMAEWGFPWYGGWRTLHRRWRWTTLGWRARRRC